MWSGGCRYIQGKPLDSVEEGNLGTVKEGGREDEGIEVLGAGYVLVKGGKKGLRYVLVKGGRGKMRGLRY